MAEPEASSRKGAILAHSQALASRRQDYRQRAAFFHAEDLRYLRFLIPEGLRVLEVGCGTGDVLAGLKPSYGLGIDFSPAMIAEAETAHPELDFRVGDVEDEGFVADLPGPFDVILILDTIGSLDDCQAVLERLHAHCTRETRMVVVYYSHLWQPLLKLTELIGWRAKHPPENVMSPADIRAMAGLADFGLIKSEMRLLSPLRLLGIGRFFNRFISTLPIVRRLSLRHYSVFRSARKAREGLKSATVVIPARNERGNIEPAVQRMPDFCEDLEIIFVEGHSKDGTWDEIERVAAAYPDRNIKTMRPPAHGSAANFAGRYRHGRSRGDGKRDCHRHRRSDRAGTERALPGGIRTARPGLRRGRRGPVMSEPQTTTYADAIREAFTYLLDTYPECFCIGQGLWSPWYVGSTMTDLDRKFGKDRVIDSPVSEWATTGTAVGASLFGYRPIVVHPRLDFMVLASDPIVNQAAKWSHMLGGQTAPRVTVRGIVNRGGEQGAQHSQALHAWYAHIPGLRVVMPATASDARDLLIASVLCDDPVIYIDDRWCYDSAEQLTPIVERDLRAEGPRVLRSGSDITLVGASHATRLCMDAADRLADQGISAEVVDLRVVNPLNRDQIVESVRRTGALLAVDGGWETCGLAGEVIASAAETVEGDRWRARPQRLTLPDAPAPTSRVLEAAYYPVAEMVAAKAAEMLGAD